MRTIGIDLGGSRLRVAAEADGAPAMVAHRYTDVRLPWVVSYDVCRTEQSGLRCRISSLKRLLDFEQAVPVPPTGVNSLDFLADILRGIRSDCCAREPSRMSHCVMAVPPCFSQRQRSALRTATKKAGFPRVRLVNDTLAVLLASKAALRECKNILAYCWGASTFSASLYRPRRASFQIVSQEGNSQLGGDDLDAIIMNLLVTSLLEIEPGSMTAANSEFLLRAVPQAEKAKLALSHGRQADVPLNGLFGDESPVGLRQSSIPLSVNVFEQATSGMIGDTLRHVREVLEAADCPRPDVVVVNGGMTHLGGLRSQLEDELHCRFASTEENAVALGAVLYGSAISEEDWRQVGDATLQGQERQAPEPACSPDRSPGSTDGTAVLRGDVSRPGSEETAANRWADNFIPLIDAAQASQGQGRLDDAIDRFEELFIELTKFRGELYRKKASELQEAGKDEDARQLLADVHQQDRSNRLVAADLGRLCYRMATEARKGKKSKITLDILQPGIDALEAVHKQDATCSALLAQLSHLKACTLCDLGRLDEAEEEVKRSVQLDSKHEIYGEDLQAIRDARSKNTRRRRFPFARAGRENADGNGTASSKRRARRNEPCPCGSGKKYKKCCGR